MWLKRKNLLLLLLVPPPFGGGEIQGLRISEYYRNISTVRCLLFSRSWANKSTQGRISLRNILYGIYYLLRSFYYIVIDFPRVIYFSIPKNFAAFLRMIPLLYVCRLLGIKLYGELAGASFDFLGENTNRFIKFFSLHALHKLSSIRFLGNSIANQHSLYSFRHPFSFSNGIDVPDEGNSLRYLSSFTKHLSLLYVGELSISKGILRILAALLLCKNNNLNVVCTFLGEWRLASTQLDIMQFIVDNNLSEHCIFVGLQKSFDKWEYFSRSHVLVHPTDRDGQPLSILEALGSGLAIISTHIGAIPDTIISGINGYLMSEISSSELYKYISVLYNDRPSLDQIRRHNVYTFNTQYTLDRYLEINNKWLHHEIDVSLS